MFTLTGAQNESTIINDVGDDLPFLGSFEGNLGRDVLLLNHFKTMSVLLHMCHFYLTVTRQPVTMTRSIR